MKSAIAKALNTLPYSLYRSVLGKHVPIFMLHRIENKALGVKGHDPSFIRSCLAYVKRAGFHTPSLETLVSNPDIAQNRSVVFTIDDGFHDNIVDAGDIFAEFDIPLTCFVISKFVDRELWPWDDQITFAFKHATDRKYSVTLPDGSGFDFELDANSRNQHASRMREKLKTIDQTSLYAWLEQSLFPTLGVDYCREAPEAFQPASWGDIERFLKQGHSVAPHTCTHRIMSRISEAEGSAEISASYARLKQKIGEVSPVFAYPTGRTADFNQRNMAMCAEQGLLAAVSTTPGYWTPTAERMAIPRLAMPSNEFDFLQYVASIEACKTRVRGKAISGEV